MESMRRSLGHALNRQLSAGWGAWVEMAVDRAEFMRKLKEGRLDDGESRPRPWICRMAPLRLARSFSGEEGRRDEACALLLSEQGVEPRLGRLVCDVCRAPRKARVAPPWYVPSREP